MWVLVVYLLIPTSNHNVNTNNVVFSLLYIFWFLHQTTTTEQFVWSALSCISFDSYIKPQLSDEQTAINISCISFDSYIKPQLNQKIMLICNSCISFDSYIKPQPITNANANASVVYLLIPTSNHNLSLTQMQMQVVVYLLIPTSNHNLLQMLTQMPVLYIFWFLHQTTTKITYGFRLWCCISFDSYIKPQPAATAAESAQVVYLLIPTSNHNFWVECPSYWLLYIFWFLHQTTTPA